MSRYSAAEKLAEIEHELKRRRENWRSAKNHERYKILEDIAADYQQQGDGYDSHADVAGYFDEAYRVIRERKAAGGPGWKPKE